MQTSYLPVIFIMIAVLLSGLSCKGNQTTPTPAAALQAAATSTGTPSIQAPVVSASSAAQGVTTAPVTTAAPAPAETTSAPAAATSATTPPAATTTIPAITGSHEATATTATPEPAPEPSQTASPTPTPSPTKRSSSSSSGGGGGSSKTYYTSADILGTAKNIKTSSSGRVSSATGITSPDGSFKLEIADDTVIHESSGSRLQTLTVSTGTPPEANEKTEIASIPFIFSPEGATFTPGIAISYSYDPDSLSENINPDDLSFYYYDESASVWTEQTSTLNADAGTVSCTIDHFSTYAVLGKTTKIVHSMDPAQQPEEIEVPYNITNIVSFGPVETQLLFMLAPEKLGGINFDWNSSWDDTPPFIDYEYPIIGNASGKAFNLEAAIAANPGVQVVIEGKASNYDSYKDSLAAAGIPYIRVTSGADLLTEYGPEIEFVGNLLNVQDRAQKLLDYYEQAMEDVNSIVGDIRSAEFSADAEDSPDAVRVYYAEGTDGLASDPKGNWHTTLLWYCGGANVAVGLPSSGTGMPVVTEEQILSWEADVPIEVIILGRSSTTATYEEIVSPDSWWYQLLSCVPQGKVYIRPQNPVSWFDGPPGYGQIIGMYWMVNLLYPEQSAPVFSLEDKIEEFYSDFLHHDLTEDELDNLLSQPGE